MIGYDHEVADFEIGIHTSGSVRYEKRLYTQHLHDPYRKSYLLHGIAFVIMKAALHGENLSTAEIPGNELSAVPFNGRKRKVRDFSVKYLLFITDVFGQFSESCS